MRAAGRLPSPPARRGFIVRHRFVSLLGLVTVLAVMAGLGVMVTSIGRPAASPPLRRPDPAGPTRAAIAGVGSTTTTLSPPPMEPTGGQTLFPSHRLVAFYGAPASPGLGVLGDAPPETLWSRLAAAAASYATPGVAVVPSYELIAFTAQASAGHDGSYSAQLPAAEISSYLQVVRAHDGMLILDIQPGRNSLLSEAQALQPWLVDAHVGLALDPEWELQAGQRPDRQVGHTTAAEIDQVSAWLNELTVANRLPQKLLLIHQFRAAMIPDKPAVTAQPNLAIAFNMDGFGETVNKLSVYQLLASDARWALGYKLFYTSDRPLQDPAQVLNLTPPPDIVEYE